MPSDTLDRTEAILRFREEADRRFAEHGVTGPTELIDSWRPLRAAIDAVPLAELERFSESARSLCAELGRMERALGRLNEREGAQGIEH